MAQLSVSGMTLLITGLTSGKRYAFRVYYSGPNGSGDWREPTSGTELVNSTSYRISLNSLNMNTAGTYSFYVNVWDAATNTNTTTNTATKTVTGGGGSITRTHYARCGTGVSQFKIYNKIITSTSSTSFTCSEDTMTISGISCKSGYSSPYTMAYNTKSSPSDWNAGSKTISSYETIDATFTRRITISAAQEVVYYPYTQYVYLDGNYLRSATNSSNTSSSVLVSSLPAYTAYKDTYKFDYASANGKNYASSAYISLTAGSSTSIYLYFLTKSNAVAPTLSVSSKTETTITLSWDKNGGGAGSYRLYYRQGSSASWILYGTYTGTIATVTGLTAGTTYYFYVQNYVSSSDYKNSNQVGATTEAAKVAVAPTLTIVSTDTNSISISWDKNGGTDGEWRVMYGTSATNLHLYGSYTGTSATITGLEENTTYYIQVVNFIDSTRSEGSSIKTAKTKSSTPAISYFSWTSNDAANIKTGNSFSSFITATGWNNLTAKINECRTKLGYSTISFTQANSGNTLTAEMYNTVKNNISNLTSAGTVAADVSKGSIAYATLFANSSSALKEAINRVVATLNT